MFFDCQLLVYNPSCWPFGISPPLLLLRANNHKKTIMSEPNSTLLRALWILGNDLNKLNMLTYKFLGAVL